MKGSTKELFKRYGLLVAGLFLSAMGVAFTKHAELGVSPVSSIPNILSYRFPFLTMGNWLILWNITLLFGQILLLRRRFRLIQILQIPLSFLFGYFTDFGLWCLSAVPASFYPVRLLFVFLGVGILGLGISLTVVANVVMNSGEAFVKAIADATGKDFGSVKIAFDVTSVAASILLSLLFFDFTIVGAREGTVLSAVLTGVAVKGFTKRIKTPLSSFLSK